MYLISKLEVEFKITYPIIKENKNKEKIFIKRQKNRLESTKQTGKGKY